MSTRQELTEAIDRIRQDIAECLAELQAINERKLDIVHQVASDEEFLGRAPEIQELNARQHAVGSRFAELRQHLEELEAQLRAVDLDRDEDKSND
jgi:hypothetical protein